MHSRQFLTLAQRCRLHHHQVTTIPQETRAWQIHRFVPSAVEKELHLTHTRRPPPITQPGDLLVHVDAASVNPIDSLMLSGYGAPSFHLFRKIFSDERPREFPLTPGRDFAGVVTESGPLVSEAFPPGTPVMGATLPHSSSQGSGSLADYLTCPAHIVARRPEKLDPVSAAAVSYAGLTAWSALKCGGMDPLMRTSGPRRVLVTGATGAVGAIAIQLARLAGASHLTATAPARAKESDLKAKLGVDEVIFAPELPPATTMYDVIIDCVRPPIYKEDQRTSAPEWKHIEFHEYFPLLRNLASSPVARYVTVNPPLLEFIDRWGFARGIGTSVASLLYSNFHTLVSEHAASPLRWAFFQPSGKRLQHLGEWVAQDRIYVPIEKVFPFNEAPQAFQKMNAGGNNGKIVLKF